MHARLPLSSHRQPPLLLRSLRIGSRRRALPCSTRSRREALPCSIRSRRRVLQRSKSSHRRAVQHSTGRERRLPLLRVVLQHHSERRRPWSPRWWCVVAPMMSVASEHMTCRAKAPLQHRDPRAVGNRYAAAPEAAPRECCIGPRGCCRRALHCSSTAVQRSIATPPPVTCSSSSASASTWLHRSTYALRVAPPPTCRGESAASKCRLPPASVASQCRRLSVVLPDAPWH